MISKYILRYKIESKNSSDSQISYVYSNSYTTETEALNKGKIDCEKKIKDIPCKRLLKSKLFLDNGKKLIDIDKIANNKNCNCIIL